MDRTPSEGDPLESKELREILMEVAETLEAVIIALQAERAGSEPGYVIREAVRRVVALRQHLDAPGGPAV